MKSSYARVLIVMASLLLTVNVLSAQMTEFEFGTYTYWADFPCDIDLDGKKDLVGSYGEVITDFRDPFSGSEYLLNDVNCSMADSPDFNGDMYPDLFSFILYNEEYRLSVAFNDQQGGFTQELIYTIPTLEMTIEFSQPRPYDADEDGDFDIQLKHHLFVNDGAGNFAHYDYPGLGIGSFSAALSAGSVDYFAVLDNQVLFYAGGVGYSLGSPTVLFDGQFNAIDITRVDQITDWDLDGDGDLVLYKNAGFFWGEYSLMENLGNGFYGEPVFLFQSEKTAFSDFDNDGDVDVVSEVSLPGHTIQRIFENDNQFQAFGAPAFEIDLNSQINYVYEITTTCSSLSDIDLDGDVDVLITAVDYTFKSIVYLNLGNFEFSHPIAMNANGIVQDFELYDINNDGLKDMSFTFRYETFETSSRGFYLQNEDGDFLSGYFGLIAEGVAGDFNADGIPDEAVYLTSETRIYFYPQGDYQSPNLILPGSEIPVFSGTLNTDLYDDIITKSDINGTYTVWLSDGTGGYQVSSEMTSTINMDIIDIYKLKDVNFDGLDDVISHEKLFIADDIDFITYDFPFVLDVIAAIDDLNGDGYVDFIYRDMETPQSITLMSEGNYQWNQGDELGYVDFSLPYDFDLDGDLDIINTSFIIENEGGVFQSEVPLEPNFMWQLAQNYDYFERVDFDGDMDFECLYLPAPVFSGTHYFGMNESVLQQEMVVQGNLFTETNANGIMEDGESGVHMLPISASGINQSAYTWSNGQYAFAFENDGSYQITAPLLENWSYSTPDTVDVMLTAGQTLTTVVDFGIVPNGTVSDLHTSLTVMPGLCQHLTAVNISLQNIGTTVVGSHVVLSFPTIMSFHDADPSPSVVSGNQLIWEIEELEFFETENISLFFVNPDLSFIGSILDFELQTECLLNGTITETYLQNYSYEFSCAYDPNDIQELNGYTEAGYFLNGSELEYVIRFQNVGNAPAEDVRIENPLSPMLDRSTLIPVAWSHDFDLVIDENDNAVFLFNDINLPDSVNNEAESHGFVRYRIMPYADLTQGTIVNNSAAIYFDQNPPVITNTEVNTVYDCVDLQQAEVNSTTFCDANEMIVASNGAIWVDSLTWNYNDNQYIDIYALIPVAGGGDLTMVASNELCEYSESWDIGVFQFLAGFIIEGNTLIANDAASYQWYLNGVAIEDAQNSTYTITESGEYSVLLTNSSDCADLSDGLFVTYIRVEEFESNVLYVYPIPALNELIVESDFDIEISSIEFLDVAGRLLQQLSSNGSNRVVIDLSNVASGIYFLKTKTQTVRVQVL